VKVAGIGAGIDTLGVEAQAILEIGSIQSVGDGDYGVEM